MTARTDPSEDATEPEPALGPAEESQQPDDAREDVGAGGIEPDEDVDAWLDHLRCGESLFETSSEASLPLHTE